MYEVVAFQSRSQAIAEMVCQSTTEYARDWGSELMAGTITMFYDESRPGLLQRLADIQRQNIREVISSQHVLLESNHTMEVLLVQGPGERLRHISNELISCKGVRSGRLTISPIILPPIHPLPDR